MVEEITKHIKRGDQAEPEVLTEVGNDTDTDDRNSTDESSEAPAQHDEKEEGQDITAETVLVDPVS